MDTAVGAYAATPLGGDAYLIPGAGLERVRKALALLSAADEVQAEGAAERRDQLVRTMMRADVASVPEATIRQAHRLARQRERLLASGAYTIEALAQLRGDTAESATRTWLTRRRKEGKVFSVTYRGATLVPSFQLDEYGEPRAELAPVIARLLRADLGVWALWTWMTSRNAWLDGAVAADVARRDADRVRAAADAYAANLLSE